MIVKRRIYQVIALLFATASLACTVAHGAPPKHSPKWANDFLSRWYIYYNSGNATRLAGMFTIDARFGADHGRRAIEASMAADFEKTQYQCAGNYDGVQELGELAVAWGHESCLETSKANMKGVQTFERWLLVFRRQSDGSWLLSEETFAAEDVAPAP